MIEEKRKGHYDLYNILNKYKRAVTFTEIYEEVAKEGWIKDFNRMGINSISRAINNHNKKYNGKQLEYK